MTPEQFKAARNDLGYSQPQLAEEWGMGVNGQRTIRRWERKERPLNPIAAYCISLMLKDAGMVATIKRGDAA